MRETRSPALRGLGIAFAALILVAGCDIETLRIQICPDGLDVLVSTEPQAEFSWSGGCGVGELVVREAGTSGRIIWQIQDRDASNRLLAPIRFGAVPSEATELIAPAQFEPGRLYVVEVKSLQRIQGRVVVSGLGSGSFRR
ncbi:MAG: hypothetical protein HKM89_14300 [Gemmatimonadales bacterium]|nr:hypothetical protein [Gemmatimonadales bacterium]